MHANFMIADKNKLIQFHYIILYIYIFLNSYGNNKNSFCFNKYCTLFHVNKVYLM